MSTKVVFSSVILLYCLSVVFTFPHISIRACLALQLRKQSKSGPSIVEENVTADIPKDFPRRVLNASLTGAAPKLSVRLMEDGTYSNMATDAEHQEAYENAEDLAQHLKNHVLRKERENPNWSREFNLECTKKGVETKIRAGAWDLEPPELAWVMKRVVELLA